MPSGPKPWWGNHGAPLLACRGPQPEVWQVSGYGSVFVARRQPDGREAWTLALLSLSSGGVTLVSGRHDIPPGGHREMLVDLADLEYCPPSTDVPEEVAARYVYGACLRG